MRDAARFADALWRAVTYVSVAQLHLNSNPLSPDLLVPEQVKPHPAGHWGTVPGNAFALSHAAIGSLGGSVEIMPILGAGHAGVVQIAMAWLTGELAAIRPQFSRDADGLSRLVHAFPDVGGLGAEVSPLLPAGSYLGGQLGGALAFAQGMALDIPDRVVMPILGDGECETPTTAASWLAAQALPEPCPVLPVVHVNGYRMGGRSQLGRMDDASLCAYADGLGWKPAVVRVDAASYDEHREFHRVLQAAAAATAAGIRTVIFLRCVKGWSGPSEVSGRPVLNSPNAHKTPITDPQHRPEQFATLAAWLSSYRPAELFNTDGTPRGMLADALNLIRRDAPPRVVRPRVSRARSVSLQDGRSFSEAVTTVLRRHAATGDLRVFSPDEMGSNRLGEVADEPWVSEILAEEVLLGWLAGWTATGRRGLLISYEAFAPLLTTGLVQLLKQHRLINGSSPSQPSLTLLLTSYGWNNVYTHGDPSLITALLATGDPAVRVLTPADPGRLAAALDDALCSTGRLNVILAGKHTVTNRPMETIDEELERGLAVWPHLSDLDEPDLTLVIVGDLPAAVISEAVPEIRRRNGTRVRVVAVHDLTVLGQPSRWPAGLSTEEIDRYFGSGTPLLIVTLGHPAAVWGLIENRLRRPVEVIGWHEPEGPMSQRELAETMGMDVAGVCAAADRLQAVRS
jgi:xylulose-5-phosphate/fructose-6-phosphate phosphoketolase